MASPDEWFDQNFDRFLEGTLERYKVLDLGLSPNFGIKRFPQAHVFVAQNVLRKVLETKHCLPADLIRPLPSLLRNSVRVFRSKHEENTAIFELPASSEGEPLVLVAKFAPHRDFGTSYFVTSIHARPPYQLEEWTSLGLLLFRKQKTKSCRRTQPGAIPGSKQLNLVEGPSAKMLLWSTGLSKL